MLRPLEIDLPPDVIEELEDKRFLNRKHNSRATHTLGCHGPLCRMAERDRGRRRYETKRKQAGLDYEVQPDLREEARDEELRKIIEWYFKWREDQKLAKAS